MGWGKDYFRLSVGKSLVGNNKKEPKVLKESGAGASQADGRRA